MPRVETPDIFAVDVETITDPDLRVLWHSLVETNPELSEEILIRAFTRANELSDDERNPNNIAAIAIHVSTFALGAMAEMLRRTDRAPLNHNEITDVA